MVSLTVLSQTSSLRVISHWRYHLQQEVMTSGCCVIVDNTSPYHIHTHRERVQSTLYQAEVRLSDINIIMSRQSESTSTGDNQLQTPEKVMITIHFSVLNCCFILLSAALLKFTMMMMTFRLKHGHLNVQISSFKFVILFIFLSMSQVKICQMTFTNRTQTLSHVIQMAIWRCCDFDSWLLQLFLL